MTSKVVDLTRQIEVRTQVSVERAGDRDTPDARLKSTLPDRQAARIRRPLCVDSELPAKEGRLDAYQSDWYVSYGGIYWSSDCDTGTTP